MLAASSCLLSVRPRAHTHTEREGESTVRTLEERHRKKKEAVTDNMYLSCF